VKNIYNKIKDYILDIFVVMIFFEAIAYIRKFISPQLLFATIIIIAFLFGDLISDVFKDAKGWFFNKYSKIKKQNQ
jgi:hypothetical protein